MAVRVARVGGDVGGLQRGTQIVDGEAVVGQLRRIQLDQHRALRCPDRIHVARAGHAFQRRLERVRHFGQLHPPGLVRPQGQRHDGHVVDAHRLDDRLSDTESGRNPVEVRIHLVVQAGDRRLTRHTHFELDGDHRRARPAHRVHVLDAADLGQLLFQRKRNQVGHVVCVGALERHRDRGHGDLDLRIFLARRHDRCREPQQQTHQRQQRRDLGRLERARDAPGNAEPILAGHAVRPLFRVRRRPDAAATAIQPP